MDRRTFLKTSAASLGAMASAASGCSSGLRSKPPNIVIIVMDTVRRDHLSCYGYARETSPFLTSLLGECRQYTNAYATSCWTFPSHASMFTGLYPTSHGARWGNVHLSEDIPVLPDILSAAGYDTVGVAENGLIGPSYGYDHGWKVLRNPGMVVEGDTTAGVRESCELLPENADKPFFFFLNLISAHQPYGHGGPFQGHFLSDPKYKNIVMPLFLKRIVDGSPMPGKKFRRHITEHYDAEILFVDLQIRQIVDHLKKIGAWDNTLFIVTADHGEGLGEHDHYEHQFALHEHLIQIPLLVRWPGFVEGDEVVSDFVTIADLFPTVLSAAGLDTEAYPSQARDLLNPSANEPIPVITEYSLHQGFRESVKSGVIIPLAAQTQFDSPELRKRFAYGFRTIREGDMKLVLRDDGVRELYDLRVDPGELNDLASEPAHSATVTALEKDIEERLDAFRRMRDGETGERELSDDAIEQLKALGYL